VTQSWAFQWFAASLIAWINGEGHCRTSNSVHEFIYKTCLLLCTRKNLTGSRTNVATFKSIVSLNLLVSVVRSRKDRRKHLRCLTFLSLSGAGADRHVVKRRGTCSWRLLGGSAVFAMACPPAHEKPPEQCDKGSGEAPLAAPCRNGRGTARLSLDSMGKNIRNFDSEQKHEKVSLMRIFLPVRCASLWSRSVSLRSTKTCWLRRYKTRTTSSGSSWGAS